jgi:hypothetical protein
MYLLSENSTRSNLTGTGRFVAVSTANNTVMSPKRAPLQPQGVVGSLQITTPDPALVKTHLSAATAKGNIAPVTHTVPNNLNQYKGYVQGLNNDAQVSRYHESIKNNPNKSSTQQISLSIASPTSARQTN